MKPQIMEKRDILSQYLYKDIRGRWAFDDSSNRIQQEPFVAGMDLVTDCPVFGSTSLNRINFLGSLLKITQLHMAII